MGTGKTLMALTLLSLWGARRSLVVCPLVVCDVWREQAEQHGFTDLEVVPLSRGSVARRLAKAQVAWSSGKRVLLVVNYESVWRKPLSQWLMKQQIDALICDEVHRAKAPQGAASKFLGRLADNACSRRLGLTGTPMPHGPLDVFAQYRVLKPSLFGWSFTRFRSQYAIIDSSPGFPKLLGYRNLEQLGKRMSEVTYVVGDVMGLEEPMHQRVLVDLNPKASRVYKQLDKELRADIEDGVVTSAANAMVRLLRLQQVTGGSAAVDSDGATAAHRIDHAKSDAVESLLTDMQAGEPVVVFCRFVADIDAVRESCAKLGISSSELSGHRKELDEWKAGKTQVLIAQVATGKEGIDLTRARYCIYYSLGYSLGDYEQSLKRVHRPGQTRRVSYYHLVARDTVDTMVYDALRRKKNVVEHVLDCMTEKQKEVKL